MKRAQWEIKLGIILVLATVLLYIIHFLIFRDPHHIFIYLFGDIAFLPLEVLLVTLIIHRLLEHQEKQDRMEKINMVIGTFFSEAGTKLLAYFSSSDIEIENMKEHLFVDEKWSDDNFQQIRKTLHSHNYKIEIGKIDLSALRTYLINKRMFLVNLLDSPVLLEHEKFTDLLMSVFHLTEELECRDDIQHIPASDRAHLANDIKRAYSLLAYRWLDYAMHLKHHYPYLFSLVVRTNPFNRNASPVITGAEAAH